MRDYPHPRKPHVKEGGVRMENKTKILTFAAVALMFAVCFIGFVAIDDGEVDADDTSAISSTNELAGMYDSNKITFADGKYTLNEDATVTLSKNVDLSGVKFVGAHTLTITSEDGKHYALTVNYDFGTEINNSNSATWGIRN